MATDDLERLSAGYRRYLAAIVMFHLAAADEVGIGATDYQALNVLDVDGPMTSGELAQRLALSTGATTRLIDRLEASDVARRVPDPADRRRVMVEATGRMPDGMAEVLGVVREPVSKAFTGLDEHQLEGLATYLATATDAYRAATRELRARP
ncbi:MarR family winged helix-turn-helix transcriptional regulator [Agromyces sp. NPDC057865]|uniref:MarR family winged helix-turn-helix transcriptional regulator n=1 Tax=Agromyces sp. NPDC057865 TaxID=3346267 RepID=UPI00366A619C